MTRPSHSDYSINNKMKMKKKKKKKFQVFEFDDDQSVEQISKRFSGQFGNFNKKSDVSPQSPITKYHFLQSFARGTEIVDLDSRNESIDVDVDGRVSHFPNLNFQFKLLSFTVSVVTQGTKTPEADCNGFLDIDPKDVGCHCTSSDMSPNSSRPGDAAVKVEMSGLDAYLISSSSTHKSKQFGRVLSETSSIEISSSSTSTFHSKEDHIPLEKQLIEPDCDGDKIDDKNMTVKIFPDNILYQELYSMDSCLTFSCHCIKVEGSTFTGTGKTFYFEWAIGDVINIESEWSGLVKTASVIIHLKSKTSKGAENANKTSGVEQLQFSIYDPHWAKSQEAIKRLDVRYKDNWNIDFDAEMARGEKHLFGQSSMFSLRCYVSGSDEPFEDIIYPEGDPDAVTISTRDIELLQPETFINDTIIDFYIKYLATKIQSGKKHRFHFFNCFFFRKLADLDKDPSSANEGKAAFQRVRKWTRKVNIFEKDYIFIPVNYSLHWSLLVICHPGEVPNLKDEEPEGTPKLPCILHMDSIKGSHKGLKNVIQSYLCEEWKERHSGTTEDVSSKFLNLRFVPLELPQQENLFDCGIFLLHYVELFLEEAPLEFSPFNISKFSRFLSRNWFPPAEASLKRPVIKKLLYEIIEDFSHKTPPADSIAKYPSVGPSETGNQETGVMFLEKRGSPIKTCHDTASSSSAEQIGISLSENSLLKGDLCFKESGAFAGSSTDAKLQLSAPYRSSILSPIQEAVEVGEQVADSPLDMENCQKVAESTSDLYSTSHCRDLEALGNHEASLHFWKLDEGSSVSGISIGSRTLSDLEICVGLPLQDLEGSDHLAQPDKEESLSTSCNELAACVVQDSEEEDSDEIKYIPPSSIENDFILSTKKDHSAKNIIRKRNYLPSGNDDALSVSDELQTGKMRRLQSINAPRVGRRLTRSLSKALHL